MKRVSRQCSTLTVEIKTPGSSGSQGGEGLQLLPGAIGSVSRHLALREQMCRKMAVGIVFDLFEESGCAVRECGGRIEISSDRVNTDFAFFWIEGYDVGRPRIAYRD